MRELCQAIKELRSQVEYSIDHTIQSYSDLRFLAMLVSEKTCEMINPDIFKPIWQIDDDVNTSARISTVHILAEFLNFKSWREFEIMVEKKYKCENCSSVVNMDSLVESQLKRGDLVEIGWSMRSFVCAEYGGEGRFIIRESIHTKLAPGDTFVCHEFHLRKPAMLKGLCTNTTDDLALVIGSKDGLKSIQIL